MNIAIDLDDTLVELIPALIKYLHSIGLKQYTFNSFTSYKFDKVLKCSRRESFKKLKDFFKTDYFRNLKPLPYCQDILQRHKNHNYFVITSRSKFTYSDTINLVEQHFSGIFKDIVFTQGRNKITKQEACNQLKIDLLIEDNLDYALQCYHTSRRVVLISKPWNASPAPDLIKVKDWRQIEPFLENSIK